jgi:hypothetical protein
MGEPRPRWPHTGAAYPEWTWQVSDKLHTWVDDCLRDARATKRSLDNHGQTEASENWQSRINAYEQYAAELDQRDTDARQRYEQAYRQWQERDRFTRVRNSLWYQVLFWARSGELPRDWRDHLSGYHARCAAIGGGQPDLREDIDGLALHEFTTLPTQPWEPYATGGDWRAALTAWYRDSLTLHDRTRQQREEMHANQPQPFRLPIRLITDEADSDPWLAMDTMKALSDADFDAIQAINHARKRDRIEAWYRAGLAAGGDDTDWRGWYRERINNTWDRRQDRIYARGLITADRELGQLGEIVGEAAAGGWRRIHMQALPHYWTHDAGS